MRMLIALIAFGYSVGLLAQQPLTYNKYWVQFKDKNGTPYNISQPESFLSAKAIERRQLYNIAITETDLPVNPTYLQAVKDVGVNVLYASKWFNGIVVQISDSTELIEIGMLPFVSVANPVSMQKPKSPKMTNNGLAVSSKKAKLSVVLTEDAPAQTSGGDVYYGTAFHQINMLMGDYLHAYGYKGEGMTVGVLDAGFINVDVNPAFETMRNEGRLLGSHDFVDGDTNVFESSEHGANVLSIMAADLPGTYVGSAPKASYWLLRTEFANTETLIEEYNWAAGAEFADSVGVDVINSSLGYSTFDYPDMNHTYADMDGNKTIITRAADIAAQKGILVVTSAGNLGGQDWHYMSAPADADSVLTVGAVDSSGVIGYFSSNGPTSDGRVKPNVVGQGVMTAYVNVSGNTSAGNGTSYSSPLMAGLVTCLWQSNRNKNNMSIIREAEHSANLFDNPNGEYGYGLPNFYNSMLALGVYPSTQSNNNIRSFLYPNPFNTELNVYYYAPSNGLVKLEFMDVSGRVLSTQQQEVYSNIPYRFTFNEWQDLARGVYFVRINNANGQQILKAMKVD